MTKISRFAVACVISTLPISPVLAQEAGVAAPEVASSAAPSPYSQQFGLAMRGRYVMVPSWMLGLFTKEATPLNTGHPLTATGWGAEKMPLLIPITFRSKA
jgi:hypothetical protein